AARSRMQFAQEFRRLRQLLLVRRWRKRSRNLGLPLCFGLSAPLGSRRLRTALGFGRPLLLRPRISDRIAALLRQLASRTERAGLRHPHFGRLALRIAFRSANWNDLSLDAMPSRFA